MQTTSPTPPEAAPAKRKPGRPPAPDPLLRAIRVRVPASLELGLKAVAEEFRKSGRAATPTGVIRMAVEEFVERHRTAA